MAEHTVSPQGCEAERALDDQVNACAPEITSVKPPAPEFAQGNTSQTFNERAVDSAQGLPQYAANQSLLESWTRIGRTSLNELFAKNPQRADKFSVQAAGIYLDYSKNLIDDSVFNQLLSMAEEAKLQEAINSLFRGDKVNITEQRSALHTALRDRAQPGAAGPEISDQVNSALGKMYAFAHQMREGNCRGYSGKPIRDIVVLGIGGSYLGPKLVCEALKDFSDSSLNIQFVASLDPAELLDVLELIDPEQTLFIVSSKSFSTLETLENGKAAKAWLIAKGCPVDSLAKHFIATTANQQKAVEFGVSEQYTFPLWDWVGGRYSLWSSVGLPILLTIGQTHFEALLAGAWEMDEHFRTAPFARNMPVILAMLGVWCRNYLGASAHAISPYSYRLRSLTEHLQQLDMESNGKGVDAAGNPVGYATGPIILGGMGNNGQHAYYQLLHQGPEMVPVDFILPLQPSINLNNHQQHLLANGIGQAQALMQGRDNTSATAALQVKGACAAESEKLAPHLVSPGNQPSNSLVLERLTPKSLGALLVLYEHKVHCQGIIWDIVSFDQWGVELGKELGGKVYHSLANTPQASEFDGSTEQLIERYKNLNSRAFCAQ